MRYMKIKREQRICTICNDNQVGDEMHYLSYCKNKNIEKNRNEFMHLVKNLQPQFRYFNNNNNIIK